MDKPYRITDQADSIQVLCVSDLLSEVDNRQIMQAVESKIDKGFPNFIVDLSEINYMNSVGINFLIKLRRKAQAAGGKLAVVHASGKVKQLLDITKLRPMFFLTDSMQDAVAFITSHQ